MSTAPPTPGQPTSRPPSRLSSIRVRVALFIAICVLAVGLGVAGVLIARRNHANAVDTADTVPVADVDLALEGVVQPGESNLLFESTALGDTYGRLSTVPVDAPDGPRHVAEMQCERVDYRAGTGVCLQSDRGLLTTYDAVVFDNALDEHHTVGLSGAPSRVRVSPKGTIAGVTVFVTGHSYAIVGFSTQTLLIDLADGDVIADLEVDFTTRKDGDVFQAVDFNFWGVTFIDEQHFYATLGTGGNTYLVEGDVEAREMEVQREGVECPSLSPDGTRIAFKTRSDPGAGPITWRIAVLDLATSEVTELAETRNVDDQVAWLDDSTIMYGLESEDSPASTDTWVVPADGSGAPRMLLAGAWSTGAIDG